MMLASSAGTMPGISASRSVRAATRPVDLRHRAEQPDRIGMLRLREQSGDRRLLDLAAGIHDHDAVGDLGDHAEVVGDQDDRGAEFASEVQ